MSMSETDDVLNKISTLLASGLETKTEPFPETEKEFGEILKELRALDPDDLKGKLVIGGFVNPSLWRRAIPLHGMHVLSRAPQMVRSAGAGGPRRTGMVVPPLAHLMRGAGQPDSY